MKFIIQKEERNDTLSVERSILLDVIGHNRFTHTHFEMSMKEVENLGMGWSKMDIPIGTIDFVTKVLQKSHDFDKENPIEIPKYLRTDEFLKRDYKVVTWDNIPKFGRYSLKDASTLKHFSYTGNMEYFIDDSMFEEPTTEFDHSLRLSKDALYVVSKEVKILSEYRVYVIDNEICAIANYDGDCTLFPDTELLKKAVQIIEKNEKWLKSYTIDIMITKDGTSIIEIHNFTSIGLYTTMFNDKLCLAYRQGINYLLQDNKKIEV